MAVALLETVHERQGRNLVARVEVLVGTFEDENEAQAWIHKERDAEQAKLPRELRSTFRIVPAEGVTTQAVAPATVPPADAAPPTERPSKRPTKR